MIYTKAIFHHTDCRWSFLFYKCFVILPLYGHFHSCSSVHLHHQRLCPDLYQYCLGYELWPQWPLQDHCHFLCCYQRHYQPSVGRPETEMHIQVSQVLTSWTLLQERERKCIHWSKKQIRNDFVTISHLCLYIMKEHLFSTWICDSPWAKQFQDNQISLLEK